MIENKGFTLVEIVVAIVVVGLLSIVSVPIYKGYVNKSIASEGRALLTEINAAQQVFYLRNKKFYGGAANQITFGVDARRNKYFTTYSLTTAATSFTATTSYGGKSLTLRGYLEGQHQITDNFTNG